MHREASGQRYVTTEDVLREETRHDRFCEDGRGRRHKLAGTKRAELDPQLSEEQREAALRSF